VRRTIRTTFAGLAAVVALSLSGCSDDSGGDGTASGSPDSTSGNGSASPDDTKSPEGETADVFDVGLGDCIGKFEAEEQVSDVTKVPCSQKHDQEVFTVRTVPDADKFPGSEAFQAQVEDECVTEFATFVGIDFDQSDLDIQWLEPTKESWADGDRELVCTVYDPAGPVAGTLKGAKR
jgi:hypothetical protein